MHHVVETDEPRRHSFGIELHLKLPEVAAEAFHSGDPWNRQQSIVDLELGQIAQRHQICGAGISLERELENFVQPAGEARDEWWTRSCRKLARDLGDALGDELTRPVIVRVRIEFDRDLRHTELRIRSHTPHVG